MYYFKFIQGLQVFKKFLLFIILDSKSKFTKSLLVTIPFFTFLLSVLVWISDHNSQIYQKYFIQFSITIGIVFGRITQKIILMHVTKSEFPTFTILFIPSYLAAFVVLYTRLLNIYFDIFVEQLIIHFYFVFALFVYSYWSIVIIKAFCDYLGIYCFKLGDRKKIQDLVQSKIEKIEKNKNQ